MSRSARKEFAEGLVAFIERDEERYVREVGDFDAQEGRQSSKSSARALGVRLVEPGIVSYRSWLYSGDHEGNRFGPPRAGHIKCKSSPSVWQGPGATAEEIALHQLYEQLVAQLEPMEIALLQLWVRAPARARPGVTWADQVAARLNAHVVDAFRVNSEGKPWTAEAVRSRLHRINQGIAEALSRARVGR